MSEPLAVTLAGSLPLCRWRMPHGAVDGLASLRGPSWPRCLVLFVLNRVSCSPGWSRTGYVVKDHLELLVLLPLHAELRDLSHHTQFMWFWEWDLRLCACQASPPPSEL